MKARVLTAQQTRAAAAVARDIVQDSNRRVQYLWILAMKNSGLSVKTINRVAAEMQNVCDKYRRYREDGIADAEVAADLRRIGIEPERMGKEL